MSSQYDGVAAGFLVWNKQLKCHRFTDAGLDKFKELIALGCTVDEVADFLICEKSHIELAMLPGGQLFDVYRHATAAHRIAVRQNQLELSGKFATMAKFLGHHSLGQAVDPTPKDAGLAEKVVGTMPDWEGDSEEWLAANKPATTGRSTIEKLREMNNMQAPTVTPSDEGREPQ